MPPEEANTGLIARCSPAGGGCGAARRGGISSGGARTDRARELRVRLGGRRGAPGVPHVRVATGLASTEDWLLEYTGERPVEAIRASPQLSFTPPALDDGAVSHRFRMDGSAPGPNRWGEPLVYVTFGSVAAGLPLFPGVYRAALDALADLPVRVLMTIGAHGDPAELRPLPANAAVERWVPQAEVVPRGRGRLPRRLRHDGRRAGRRRASGGGAAVRRPGAQRGTGGRGRCRAGDAAGGADRGRGRVGLGEWVWRVLGDPSFGRAARVVVASAGCIRTWMPRRPCSRRSSGGGSPPP